MFYIIKDYLRKEVNGDNLTVNSHILTTLHQINYYVSVGCQKCWWLYLQQFCEHTYIVWPKHHDWSLSLHINLWKKTPSFCAIVRCGSRIRNNWLEMVILSYKVFVVVCFSEYQAKKQFFNILSFQSCNIVIKFKYELYRYRIKADLYWNNYPEVFLKLPFQFTLHCFTVSWFERL